MLVGNKSHFPLYSEKEKELARVIVLPVREKREF